MSKYKIKVSPTGALQWVLDDEVLELIKFKPGVATEGDLPTEGNQVGDARIANENHHLYVWNGTEWNDQGDIIDIDFSDKKLTAQQLEVIKEAYFTQEINNGDGGAEITIDWREGNRQRVRLTANAPIVFVNPSGPGNFVLKIVQDNPGHREITSWDSRIKWAEGSIPALTGTFNSIDIVSFYFDGTSYFAQIGRDFK